MSVVQQILCTLTVVWLEEANLPFPSCVMVAFRWLSSTMSPTYSSLSASSLHREISCTVEPHLIRRSRMGTCPLGHPGHFYLENDTQVRTLQVIIFFSQCWSRNPSTLNILSGFLIMYSPIKINSPKFCMA